MGSNDPKDLQAEFAAAMEVSDPGAARLYANGFALALAPADMTVLLRQQESTVALLTLPHPTAKQLALAMLQNIDMIERAVGSPVLTLDEIGQRLVASQQGEDRGRS